MFNSSIMKLHEAIVQLLRQHGGPMTTSEIASMLNENRWYQKKDGSPITPYQIHGRTTNYPFLFGRQKSMVFLQEQSNYNLTVNKSKKTRANSDEDYIISLCDEILGQNGFRQHHFEFLRGDPNSKGETKTLPVDAYYEHINLVVEYREKQHSESVKLFDKPDKLTVSGVSRGEQRKIYDQRRRETLPRFGINLIEISYEYFNYDNRKKIIRDKENDLQIIKRILKGKPIR